MVRSENKRKDRAWPVVGILRNPCLWTRMERRVLITKLMANAFRSPDDLRRDDPRTERLSLSVIEFLSVDGKEEEEKKKGKIRRREREKEDDNRSVAYRESCGESE